MKRQGYIAGLIVLCLLSLLVLGARAAQGEEEPTPGVARVSLIHGDVSAMRGDSGDWVATTVNAPLVHGDKITTGDRSQTEIQLDHANVLRLGPGTEAKIADLTRTQIQIQVAQGLVNYSVFKGNEADIEIDTPNMAVRPLKEGSFRIQVNSPTETQLIVRKGAAEVTTPDGSTRVEDGRIITVRGSDHPEYQIADAPHRDDWDKWNKERDNEIKDAESYRYANRYYTGAQDLDRRGRWVYVADYDDWCWTPYVNAGWVPYRDGYWGWEPYWGWTWVSYEPWGWAPYHYGRWFWRGSSWYWWPGYRYYGYYPTWAPAYVSFLGFGFGGRNWGFGFGYGYSSIGWCPLGPYDSYYPWWGYHNSYNVVNVTNITNITNIRNVNNLAAGADARNRYRGRQGYTTNLQAALSNANVRGAISQASTEDFVRGRIPRQQRPIDVGTLRDGHLVQGTVPAAPTRDSLRPINRPVSTSPLSGRTSGAENFFSRRQAPAVPRSFNEHAAGIQQMMQQRNPLQTAERAGVPRSATGIARPGTGATLANAGERPGQATGRPTGPAFGSSGRLSNATEAQNTVATRGREPVGTSLGAAQGRGFDASGARNRATPQASNQASGDISMDVRGGDQTGWQRFGQTGSSGFAGPGARSRPTAGGELAQRTTPAPRREASQSQQSQPTQPPRANWQRFGTGQPRAVPGRATTVGTPQGTQTARPTGAESRPAPQSSVGGGSRSFGAQGQPAPAGRGAAASQVRASEQPGWSRFSGRSETPTGTRIEGGSNPPSGAPTRSEGSQGWSRFPSRSASPQGTERPALELRKPIVTERSAPSSPSRNFGGGGRAAPLAPPRSFEGGGRSAPSASPRTFEGGSIRGGGWGGGNRGWSAPSGGGAMRSAPSAPSRSYGGGGGGGSRGWSAPSGGSRGTSAPSGGGRSAPAPSSRQSSPRGHR